jgi:hypothetical protein
MAALRPTAGQAAARINELLSLTANKEERCLPVNPINSSKSLGLPTDRIDRTDHDGGT